MRNTLRIALLHISPKTGEIAGNASLIESGINSGATMSADWIVTPELPLLCGYEFTPALGTEWIGGQESDPWVLHFRRLAAEAGITLFLSHPERDTRTNNLYNTVFVIGNDGMILGSHRKINIVPGVETWACRGQTVEPILVGSIRAGILVCADAYTENIAGTLYRAGAQILVSSAAWAPRPHGPEGAWEARSRETGLPLFVCNRTGQDATLGFNDAESVVAKDGARVVSLQTEESTLLLIDWDLSAQRLVAHQRFPLEPRRHVLHSPR